LKNNLSIAPSIDNYLHTHRDNAALVWLGKLAIVLLLLRAEEKSLLTVDSSNVNSRLDLKKCSDTWIGQLFTQLAVAGDFKAFLKRLSRIFFVSFNYDRCIQQFFSYAAKQYFQLGDGDVRVVLNSLNIHYIYGSIGDFDIITPTETSFGRRPVAENCVDLVDQIRIFTEGGDKVDNDLIRDYIDGARETYFLGFGFNKLNLDRIFPSDVFAGNSVFATTKGLPEIAASQVKNDIDRRIRKIFVDAQGKRINYDSANAVFKDVSCSQLIWECHRNFQTAP
jgi:hypothetical protein